MWQGGLKVTDICWGGEIAANDIVCPVLALERLRSEIDTDTFIVNDNLMKV